MTPGLTDGEMIVVSDRRSYRNFDADTWHRITGRDSYDQQYQKCVNEVMAGYGRMV